MAELQSMVRLRQLVRFHEVSLDRKNWSPAGTLKQLFQSETASAEGRAHVAEAPILVEPEVIETASAPKTSLPPAVSPANQTGFSSSPSASTGFAGVEHVKPMGGARGRQIHVVSIAQGICAGAILLLCAHIPQGKSEGHLVWWWDLFKQPGAAMWVTTCLFAVAAGVALMFVSTLLRGLPRGWSFIPLGTVGLMLMFIAVAFASVPLALTALPPALTAVLLGALFLKGNADSKNGADVLMLVLGVVQCTGTLAAGIFATYAILQIPQLPGWTIATAVVSIAGWLLLLGCGAIGIVGANTSSRAIRKTSLLLGFLGLGVLAIAAVIAGYGFTTLVEGDEGGRFLLVQMTRFLVMTYSLSALVAVGLVEVLSPPAPVSTVS